MASRYQTKVPVHFSAGGKVTIDDQGIYEEPSTKNMQKTEESTYTNLLGTREKQPTTSNSGGGAGVQFGTREKQPTTSNGEGGAGVRVVKGKTNVKAIVAITFLITACVILVLFALLMTGVVLNSSQETSKESTRSSALIDSLEDQLTQLKQEFQGQVTQLKQDYQGQETQLRQEFQGQETRLRQEFQGQETQLRQEFQGQVTQLRQELHSMHTALAIAQHDLNTSLHSPLHPYQNCHTETAETRINLPTSTTYTRRVSTPYRTINMTGYYTLDIRCHYSYHINYYSYTVVTQLSQSGSGMYCYCTVYNPSTTSDSLNPLTTSSNFNLDCILSIIRCPLAQTIV